MSLALIMFQQSWHCVNVINSVIIYIKYIFPRNNLCRKILSNIYKIANEKYQFIWNRKKRNKFLNYFLSQQFLLQDQSLFSVIKNLIFFILIIIKKLVYKYIFKMFRIFILKKKKIFIIILQWFLCYLFLSQFFFLGSCWLIARVFEEEKKPGIIF